MAWPHFIKSFSLKPRGKHVCSVCLGTACHVRGGPVIAGGIRAKLEWQAWRDHRGSRVHARDGELPGRVRAGTHRRGGWALFLECQPRRGCRKSSSRPGRAGQSRGQDGPADLPRGSRLPALQPQPDGSRASGGRPPLHPGDRGLRAGARLPLAFLPVRQLQRGIRAGDSRSVSWRISSALTATPISPALRGARNAALPWCP